MTVVLDTRDLPVEDRREALYEAFASSTAPVNLAFGGEGAPLVAKVEAWTLGPASVFQVHAPDLDVVRTERHARSDSPELLAVSVLLGRPGRLCFGAESLEAPPDQINLIDMAAPYEFSWSGSGGAWSFKVPYEHLQLDPPMVRQASARLSASPLYEVVGDHIRHLAREIDAVATDPAGSGVAVATTQLIRALLVSAIDDSRGPQEACGDALWPLIVAYVEAHLTEHDLSPARIAAAINISPRYLYKLCARHELRLGDWIVERRLRGARQELESAGSRTVASIARRWGFIDPAHFSGRFRHAFEMSPRECRDLARTRESRTSAAAGSTDGRKLHRLGQVKSSDLWSVPTPDRH
jgi:AraC-like DNA-binding protein